MTAAVLLLAWLLVWVFAWLLSQSSRDCSRCLFGEACRSRLQPAIRTLARSWHLSIEKGLLS